MGPRLLGSKSWGTSPSPSQGRGLKLYGIIEVSKWNMLVVEKLSGLLCHLEATRLGGPNNLGPPRVNYRVSMTPCVTGHFLEIESLPHVHWGTHETESSRPLMS